MGVVLCGREGLGARGGARPGRDSARRGGAWRVDNLDRCPARPSPVRVRGRPHGPSWSSHACGRQWCGCPSSEWACPPPWRCPAGEDGGGKAPARTAPEGAAIAGPGRSPPARVPALLRLRVPGLAGPALPAPRGTEVRPRPAAEGRLPKVMLTPFSQRLRVPRRELSRKSTQRWRSAGLPRPVAQAGPGDGGGGGR